jgi:hypothetical protein
MTPCIVAIGLHPEDGGDEVLRNVTFYTASEPGTPGLES